MFKAFIIFLRKIMKGIYLKIARLVNTQPKIPSRACLFFLVCGNKYRELFGYLVYRQSLFLTNYKDIAILLDKSGIFRDEIKRDTA